MINYETHLSYGVGQAGFVATRLCVNHDGGGWTKQIADPYVNIFCAAGERLLFAGSVDALPKMLNAFALRRNLAAKGEVEDQEVLKTQETLQSLRDVLAQEKVKLVRV